MSNASTSRNEPRDELIRVGGVTPFTTIDYPGELASVVFLQGCPWRCDYCHNKDLIGSQAPGSIRWDSVLDFLRQRQGLIDAVVFSGGEPTLHSGLGGAMQEVRRLGFKVGLHTAGVYPDRLRKLLQWTDWVGLDIKAPRRLYESITGVAGSAERAWRSARLMVDSGMDFEVRTTFPPHRLGRLDLYQLIEELTSIGVDNFSLQECNMAYCTDAATAAAVDFAPDEGDLTKIRACFKRFEFRKLT